MLVATDNARLRSLTAMATNRAVKLEYDGRDEEDPPVVCKQDLKISGLGDHLSAG